MKKITLIIVLITSVLFHGFAQNKIRNSVSGTVYDINGETMVGAQVWIPELKTGSACDINGYFIISNIPLKTYHINISFVGYVEKTLNIKGSKSNLKIIIHEDKNQIKGVICNGNVNSIDIRERSGVVDKVRMKTLKDKPMIDIGLALQGAVPGLVVTPSGILGAKPVIRIRGNSSLRKGDTPNQPLYVMDGKVISADAFLLLNPMDIKEIKVLKDAAACALYGVKAANGVIEITSMKGFIGKPTFTFSSDFGAALKGNRSLQMMKSEEKLKYERLAQCTKAPGYLLSPEYIDLFVKRNRFNQLQGIYNQYFNTPTTISEKELRQVAQFKLDSLRKINTDWFNILLRNTFYQNHYMSLRGGNDVISYYASTSYAKQEGQLPGNDYKKFQGKLDIDWTINKIGYVSISSSAAVGKKRSPNSSDYSLNGMIYNLNPYETTQTEVLFSYPRRRYKDLFNQFSSTSNDISYSSSISTNLRPFEGLEIGAVTGIDLVYNTSQKITPGNSYSEEHSGVEPYQRGKINRDKNRQLDFTTNIRATYGKTFNEKHEITLSTNYDYYYNNYDDISVTGYGTGNLDFLSATNMGLEGYRKPYFSNIQYQSAQLGYGLAAGYSYNSLIDLFYSLKNDASSVLPRKLRWNKSWAIGAGIHWDKLKWISSDIFNDITTRFSYGFISNLAGVQKSETVPVFSYSTNYYDDERSLSMQSMYNQKLRPEKTSSLEFGFSIGILNRHSLQVQLYKRFIDDALLDVPIPSSFGYTSKKLNIGKLMNKGIEIQLNSTIYQTDETNIGLRGNIAYNNNLVVSLYDKDAIYTSDSAVIPDYQVGQPYNLLWGWKSIGINPLTGSPYLIDNEGYKHSLGLDFKKKDLRILGRSEPPFTGSFGGSITYKSIDIDMQFYYTFGGVKGSSFQYIRDQSNSNKNAPAGLLGRTWFIRGDENKIYPSPKLSTTAYNNFIEYPNSRMLVSTAFVKFSSMAIKYRIPTNFIRKATKDMIKYWTISARGSNMFMITPYNDGSPEAASTNISVQPIFTINTTLTF